MILLLQLLTEPFTVCKPARLSGIDWDAPFCFVGRTDHELSLVSPTTHVPGETLAREDGWRCFRVAGAMPFSLVGVLAGLTGCLAGNGIPVFAVSTFDTDYLLVKADTLDAALQALVSAGYTLEG